MKAKVILVLVFLACAIYGFAQDPEVEPQTKYSTIVRVEAASILYGPFFVPDYDLYEQYGAINYGFSIYGPDVPQLVVNIVPLVSDVIGIPIVIDIGIYPKSFSFGLMSGIEFTPMKRFAPGGLFARLNAGAYWIPEIQFIAMIARADVGWQFISRGGFVITTGFGVKFNSYSGNALDVMIDVGGAF